MKKLLTILALSLGLSGCLVKESTVHMEEAVAAILSCTTLSLGLEKIQVVRYSREDEPTVVIATCTQGVSRRIEIPKQEVKPKKGT